MAQLDLYYLMGCPVDPPSHPAYQRWMYQRVVEESNDRGMAPEVADLYFRDQTKTEDADPVYRRWLYRQAVAANSRRHGAAPPARNVYFGDENQPQPTTENGRTKNDGAPQDKPNNPLASSSSFGNQININTTATSPRETTYQYRCRRCRAQLATSHYTEPHSPTAPSLFPPKHNQQRQPQLQQQPCAHIFLQPLSWMRPELEQGLLSGRLECPNAKCKTVVGRYAWQGMQCSCGQWVLPGLGLARGKVDEVAVAEVVDRPRQWQTMSPSDDGGKS